jgi:hypothetical protein
MAKFDSFVNLTEFNSSITVDNEGFLYLWVSLATRSQMYKIGSGESGTVAGKVYFNANCDREGEVTWVYCQGKLWARRVNEGTDLGHLLVYDP